MNVFYCPECRRYVDRAVVVTAVFDEGNLLAETWCLPCIANKKDS